MQRVLPAPLHLAKLTLTGCAITIGAFAETFLPFSHPVYRHGLAAMLWSVRLELLCVMLPLLCGLVLTYYNNHRLSSGVNHLCFTDDELEEARVFVNQPRLTWLQFLLFILFAIAWITLDPHKHREVSDGSIILLVAVNPLSYLRSTLRKAPGKSVSIDWNRMQPVHSDHWGQTN